jgi:two-component system cell cycle sensor histidine kinase/response regulator CckA
MGNAPAFQGTGPTVLLVEDDELLLRLLARTLEAEGFTVLKAENGEAALQVLRTSGGSVELVLTDITMPVMGGFELGRILRNLYPSIPLLFMTGELPRTSQGIPLLEVGTHLLLKPFGPDVLLEAITATLDHEQRSIHRTSA